MKENSHFNLYTTSPRTIFRVKYNEQKVTTLGNVVKSLLGDIMYGTDSIGGR